MRLLLKNIIILLGIISTINFTPAVFAQDNLPKISVIIDDLGYDEAAGLRVANLPGAVVCSILPDVQFSKELAYKCHQQNKEIILHTPMQALTPHRLGPGGLYMNMNKTTFLNTLNADIKAIPFISGLNNHEGSRLTSAPVQMDWLMQDIKPQGLFFIDSVTSRRTVAEKVARQDGMPTTHRDVFLDDVPTQAAVRAQFKLLLDKAAKTGQAVAIGHPYPATIAVLEQELPQLAQAGYVLVPVSQLILKKSIVPPNEQPVFLKQIWQQLTVNNAGVDPLTVVHTQAMSSQSRVAIVTNNIKAKPVVSHKQNTITDPVELLRQSFCKEYPDLCYLLPAKS